MGGMNHHAADLSMPAIAGNGQVSVALAQARALKRDNWSPGDPRRGSLGYFHGRFRQLLGNSEHMFAPFHLAPDVPRPHSGRSPQNRKIVEQIGALADDRG